MFTTLDIVSLAGRVRIPSELSEGDDVYDITRPNFPERVVW